VIALLNRRINEMLEEPDIVKKLEEGGLEVMRQTPAEFAAQIKRDNVKWGEIVKLTDVKME
jgi:tripartite-type tricarboxylate transporter receptor subunit TctC